MGVAESRKFEPNQSIYNAGDPAEFIYFIQEGTVEANIGPRNVSLSKGQILGHGSLLQGEYRVDTFAGPNGCALLLLPMDKLKGEIGRSPPLAQLFIQNLLVAIEISGDIILDQSSG